MRHVNRSEGDIPVKRFHCEAISVQDILLSDLYHGTAVGEDAP